jgi:nucleotide-binding universal stress UspA family protein
LAFEDILLRVVPTATDELERLGMAVDLARRVRGRLNGLFVVGNDDSKADWAKALFERAVVRSSLETTWRVMDGRANADISFIARRSDLVIVPSTGVDRSPWGRAPEQVALGSGRPILILPALVAPISVGNTVLVGWNETRESSRAIHDAMPILLAAEKIYVFTAVAEQGPEPVADIQLLGHLRQNGVRAELVRRRGAYAAAEIALEMRRIDADLLVIGLHSKSVPGGFELGDVSGHFVRSASSPLMCSC